MYVCVCVSKYAGSFVERNAKAHKCSCGKNTAVSGLWRRHKASVAISGCPCCPSIVATCGECYKFPNAI